MTSALVCKGFSLAKKVLKTEAKQKKTQKRKNITGGVSSDFYSQCFLEGSFLPHFNLKGLREVIASYPRDIFIIVHVPSPIPKGIPPV